MGVFSSFLSVVQENVAISAELLGRAGEAGEIVGRRQPALQEACLPKGNWTQQQDGINRSGENPPNRTGTPRTPHFCKAQDNCLVCAYL